jgi:hypothetical protein
VEVSDCLDDFESGVLLPVLNAVHVTGIAPNLMRDVLISATLLHAQLSYDSSKSLTVVSVLRANLPETGLPIMLTTRPIHVCSIA